jgi:RHS repeat-associated protein
MKKLIEFIGIITLLIFLRTSFALCAEQVYFYYNDPAGTPLAISDSTGNVVWRANYLPFGEEMINLSTVQNNKMFVGKEKDSESGLYYFGARYMDPGAGRFTSTDSIGPVDPTSGKINLKMLTSPQGLNRYAYALNNPYRYVDPDGNSPLILALLVAWIILGNPSQADAPTLKGPAAPAQSKSELFFGMALDAMGGPVPGKSTAAKAAINITEKGLEHVLERHVAGGLKSEGKSLFSEGEKISDLIRAAEGVAPESAKGGKFQRVVDAGQDIGTDRATGEATSVYTVITDKAGDLITAHPGVPQ